MTLHTILFENNILQIIDQTLLPQKHQMITLDSFEKSIEAIKNLRVRGAPAIGIVAAYTLYLTAVTLSNEKKLNYSLYKKLCSQMASVRPTAVNLSWAVNKMDACYKVNSQKNDLLKKLEQCAVSIHNHDKQTCIAIGQIGALLLAGVRNVLTHCNAGIFATGGNGTALSLIYEAFKKNNALHVYVDETRPLGQGARLTYYELQKNNVDCTLISDNAAASLFYEQKVDAVVLGADRITMNGDIANKIGTYNLAVLAHAHSIPFYVAAPVSSFDGHLQNGNQIEIEKRSPNEILSFWNIGNDLNYKVFNPAFDITPANFISAIITEHGILRKPYKKQISQLLKS